MELLASLLFFGSIGGLLISYPMYFYELHLFGTRLQAHHPNAWARYSAATLRHSRLQVAYKALRDVKRGELDGVPLHPAVGQSHTMATRLLYIGLSCFLCLLFVCLADSL